MVFWNENCKRRMKLHTEGDKIMHTVSVRNRVVDPAKVRYKTMKVQSIVTGIPHHALLL